jgi:hypothetical protein
MAESPKFDDLMMTCSRCNGSAIEPEPGQPPRTGGFDPNVFKYNVSAKLCTDCRGSCKMPSPAGEAMLKFLEHPMVASKIDQACSAFRSQVGWR